MAIQDINQLSPEMRQAAEPVLPVQNAIPDQQTAPAGAPPAALDQTQPTGQPTGAPAGPAVPIGMPPAPTTVPGHAEKVGTIAANIPTPPGPGGWAKVLVASARSALQSMQTGLGDFSAAKTEEGNHGILGGIGAVQNARSARLQAEQKAMDEHDRNFALTAKTNADFYHQQILNHRESGDYSDKINNEAIATGKQAVDAATLNATDAGLDPSKIIHSNITEQQKYNLLVSKNWDPTLHTVWETSSQPLIDPATGKQKEDADGSKQYQKMYTIIDTPEKIVLNADSAALLNKYLHTNFKDGQELPGALGLSQFQLAANSHALQANRDAQLAKIDESAANAQQKLAMDKAQENLGTEFLQVVSGLPNVSDQMKFVSGQHMIPDPTGKNPNGIVDPRSADYAQKHPNAPNDLIDSYGGKAKYQGLVVNEVKEFEAERKNRAAEAEKAEKDRIAAQKEKDAENPPVSNIPLTPEIQTKISSLPPASQAVLAPYDSNTKSALMSIAYGNGEQDLEKNFPSRLTKGAPGLNTQQALGVIRQINPTWSEQSYGVKQKMYASATTGKLSQQSDLLNNFIGHAAEAQRITNRFYNADPRLFKSAVNAVSKAGYGTDVVSLGEAISVVNGEFDNMVKSGYAPTQDEVMAQAALVNANSTVGQINAALKVMSHMATTRASTMNQHYKTATGDNFPNLINEDNQDDARFLGIPVEKFYTGGRIGGSGNASQQQNTQTGAPGQAAPNRQTPTGNINVNPNVTDWAGQFGGVKR